MEENMSDISGSQSLVSDHQQQHHLQTCKKCKLLESIQHLLSQKLWGGSQKSFFKKRKRPWFIVFVYFSGIETHTTANFKI